MNERVNNKSNKHEKKTFVKIHKSSKIANCKNSCNNKVIKHRNTPIDYQ